MTDKVYNIYKATCEANGKSYIGFASNFKQRIYDHKRSMNNGKGYSFHAALRKYGWDSFTWEIIFQSKDKDYLLKEMESYFITLYKTQTHENGYNISRGGEGTFGVAPHNKGKTASPELRAKLSEAHKGKKQPHKGVKKTDATKKKISASLVGNKRAVGSMSTAKDWLITFPDGTMKQIKSLLRFCTENKLRAGKMRNVADGKSESYKGYKCARPVKV